MTPRLLSEAEGYGFLKEAGIPVPRYATAINSEDAVRTAERIGYPVVMKVVSRQVIHKSDAGGVITDIRSPAEAAAAFGAIIRAVQARVPGAAIDGVIVEQQLPPGLELIIGGKTDPTFGKVLTVGAGGTLVELVRDVATRVLPIDEPADPGVPEHPAARRACAH